MHPLQLLAPARNAQIAMQAILHGADAVYMGGPSHGARAAASNSLDDIARVVDFAHGYKAKVYATLNTLVYEDEIAAVERLVRDYWRIGVDALIVQDMSLLRMKLPPIALHASTQCDIRTPRKARMLAEAGFTQLVLPRELTLDEIAAMRAAVPKHVALEAFVHGALCVCYSGDCQASYFANGRSANRGECAQMCRMRYSLYSGDKHVGDNAWLSLRDLNRLDFLPQMIEAGISSFKIEGRLKDEAYVKNTVAAYSQALDSFIAANPGYCRDSIGYVEHAFVPQLDRTFFRAPAQAVNETSVQRFSPFLSPNALAHPKYIGQPVARVKKSQPRMLLVDRLDDAVIANGDGLGYFDKKGEFQGFRVNRADGDRLHLASSVDIVAGTMLYRNRDQAWDAMIAGNTARRLIPVNARLSAAGGLSLSLGIGEGYDVTHVVDADLSPARSPQREARRRVLSKLGDTRFVLAALDDQLADDIFVPASLLADLRRGALALLESQMRSVYDYDNDHDNDHDNDPDCDNDNDYDHDCDNDNEKGENVANSLAEAFYRDLGIDDIRPAVEVEKARDASGRVVMTTRYCLRRQLGACLKQEGAKRLPGPLTIVNKAARYQLDFDCNKCEMRVLSLES